jgi:hypothetical protein
MPAMGVTFNFAHPGCNYALIAIAALPVVFALSYYLF